MNLKTRTRTNDPSPRKHKPNATNIWKSVVNQKMIPKCEKKKSISL